MINHFRKGKGRSTHPAPGPDDPIDHHIRHRVISILTEALSANEITSAKLAEGIDVPLSRIHSFFYQTGVSRARTPSLIDMVKIFTFLKDGNNFPMGLHGRRLDYPYLFENKYFTDYEIELQQENEALKKEIEELKKKLPKNGESVTVS